MTRTHTIGFIAAIALLCTAAFAGIAYANPSYFAAGVSTNYSASSSPAYLTGTVGTSTTPVYDTASSTETVSGGVSYKADSVGLLVQFTASSSLTVLNIAIEYSQDGVDWYRNYVLDPMQNSASATSSVYSVTAPFVLAMRYASSTVVGGAATAANGPMTNAFRIPTPFRYTRAVLYTSGAGNGSSNATVWAKFVPSKEAR